MPSIDRLFILTGLLFLLCGMALGLHMNMNEDFTQAGTHAHLNLLGFVVMTLFGLCYHTWPKMAEGILSKIHYVMHAVPVAISLAMLFVMLGDPATYGPQLGPYIGYLLMITYAGVLLFTFLFFTRSGD